MQFLWVMVLAVLINGLLLNVAAQFLHGQTKKSRVVWGAIAGGILTAVSLLPEFALGKTFLWCILVLLATGLIAYGVQRVTLGKLLLFALFHLSLGGITAARDNMVSMVLGAAGMRLACFAMGGRGAYIPVELSVGDKSCKLTALQDTGNTLLDPITGRSVLVVDADAARELTGLTPQQLRAPVETVAQFSGFRLIPHHTVSGSGFLLAQRIPQVKIGAWQGSALVAFSPECFGSKYQALTGGRL